MQTSRDQSSAISRYIAHVRQIPELSREEEVELARAWRDGSDEQAAARLALANLRHVVSIAISYRRYGIPLADLVAEGNFGIVHAIRKYDPDRGNRFVTYAAYWIRAYILNHVIHSWSLVGVGSGPLRSKMFFRLRRERARIAGLVGEGEAGDKLLAEKFGAPAEKVLEMARRLEARDVSLDTKVFEDGARSLVDTLVAEDQDQEERFSRAEEGARLREQLEEAVQNLDPRERYIVETRMMADPEEELSLAEIGRRLGVSRERARQLEARAKRKLRDRLQPLAA
ncbi:sigma-70 family RNA polymerase sigma factor [Polyangium aurulentum]|uniref:sigma-70 family RNA polymerase sigma factor n=1 Tax=Polyangium aurulentum TaxID=2567896 RepID=UPI0010ADB3D8|nr:RNA polymerase factor sigma-32 [Polyangium aurulentum]UQA59363.1 RNA polymerase factor sigma-32 [Polyangium aurulentum]